LAAPDYQQVRLQDLIHAPSGLVAYHLKRGEDEQAEQLLVEQAGDDLGRLRLAAYWWTSGRLDEQIDAVQRRWEQAKAPDDARLLVYLHRADGDLDAAYRIAQGLGDRGLEKALLVEMRRWADAAAMQQSHLCPLPIPWTAAGSVPALHQQIEQQGLTAAYQRLAGDAAAFDKTMEQVVQTAAAQPDDTTLQWLCVEALLLNGRVDQGLKHLAGYDPGRAFDLLSVRHQYRDALRLLGWEDGKPLDADWIASLPTRGSDDARQPIGRVESGLKVVRLLHALGRREEALAVANRLGEFCQKQPDADHANSTYKLCFEQLAAAMIAIGKPDLAWPLAAETVLQPDSAPSSLPRLFGSRANETSLWWNVLRRVHPHESAAETLKRFHGVMHPSPGEQPVEFLELVEQAIRLIEADAAYSRDPSYANVARACIARDLLDRAEEVLQHADPERIEIMAVQADLSWRRGRWDEAAERFERLWQADNDRLVDLFLAGESLRRAGRQAEAEQRQRLVQRLAIDSRARFQLARSLLERAAADEKMGQAPSGQRDSQNLHGGGLKDQAAEQCRAILRTAPPEHLEWHEATRLLGEHLMDTDPGAAAGWFELSTLDDLRTYFHLLQLPTYLGTPALIDRLRAAAAIEAGDFETAKQRARNALAAVPAEIDISENLVPRLEAAGRRDLADELFDEQFQAHVQWCGDWPDSAMLNNNLAWLAARCNRRLDDALRHAQRAVELEPNAAHLDTLAEVHFRRGDRERAVEYSEQAVALDPRNQTLRSQLDRFRATGP
jgi:tetratricopeptide (TPR) repeat protein